MPNCNSFELRGRRLMIEFTCGRCGKKHIEPFALQHKSTEGNLQCYKPPEGWQDDSLYCPMLCAECSKQYKAFLNGSEVKMPPEEVDKVDV